MVNGNDEWQHLSYVLKIHEASEAHLEACKTQQAWYSHQTLDNVINTATKQEQGYWRQILMLIVNVTLTLATQNI